LNRHLYYKNNIDKKLYKEFYFLNINKEIKDKNKINILMYDLNKKLFLQKKYDKDSNKKKKTINVKKPKYLKLRKYLLNLDMKSNVPVDLNKLTL